MNGNDNHAGNDIHYYLGVLKLRTVSMRTELKINELKDTDEWNKYMYSEFLLSGRSDIMSVQKIMSMRCQWHLWVDIQMSFKLKKLGTLAFSHKWKRDQMDRKRQLLLE